MGLTLIAILTAALLLPGIIATRAFYIAGQTREFEVAIPPLSTAEGISLVGAFSVFVHFVYVLALRGISAIPPIVALPLADPYQLFAFTPPVSSWEASWALFSGLLFLSLTAFLVGRVVGWITLNRGDKSIFYGPLSDVIESAKGDNRFITAYVLTKIEEGTRLIGYEGTVDSLFRDADRFPAKVILKDVVPFYLALDAKSPRRVETDQLIDWLAVSSTDWHNIAFRVFQFEEENTDGKAAEVEQS